MHDSDTTNTPGLHPVPSKASIIFAFAAIYIVWGSTYLAIRIGVETIPPFLMAGVRFLVAGSALYCWTRFRGTPPPQRQHWRSAAIVGILLLALGNGCLTWSEQTIPSGVAALLGATVPIWVVVINWIWHKGNRPGTRVIAGLSLGFIGAGILSGAGTLAGQAGLNPYALLMLLVATLAWAGGTVYSRTADLPTSPFLATAMQMLVAGVILLVVGVIAGEWSEIRVEAISFHSVLAVCYLILFGSLVGYSAFIWLLRTVPAARVATYAYVNPVIALILGWAIAGEELTIKAALASGIIIAGVILIVGSRSLRG